MTDRRLAWMLKVDHAGEHGAIQIYAAQIAVARWRCPQLIDFLNDTIEHERQHRSRFAELMHARDIPICPLAAFWAFGGFLLGAATALIGDRAVLVCTRAVEDKVHRHLADQVRYLQNLDPQVARELGHVIVEEVQHLDFAIAGLGEPRAFDGLLDILIGWVTEALIIVGTRGDSLRWA